MPIQSLLYYIRHTNSKNITLLPYPLTLFNSSMVLQQLFCIIRLLIEAVEDVEHGVLGSDVAPGFGAALGVDGAADVAELTEEVEGIEHDGEAGLGEGAREAGVPHQLVGVHGVVVVAAARVHGHVGGELEAEGYLEDTAEAVVEVGNVDGAEACSHPSVATRHLPSGRGGIL